MTVVSVLAVIRSIQPGRVGANADTVAAEVGSPPSAAAAPGLLAGAVLTTVATPQAAPPPASPPGAQIARESARMGRERAPARAASRGEEREHVLVEFAALAGVPDRTRGSFDEGALGSGGLADTHVLPGRSRQRADVYFVLVSAVALVGAAGAIGLARSRSVPTGAPLVVATPSTTHARAPSRSESRPAPAPGPTLSPAPIRVPAPASAAPAPAPNPEFLLLPVHP